VAAPRIAQLVVPGQFVMMRLAGLSDPLIGRALAVYDVYFDAAGQPAGIDLVFVAKGKFTTALVAAGVGADVSLWGPLGNGFAPDPVDELVIAVGGIGQTPMLLLAAEALGRRQFAGTLPSGDELDAVERPAGYARRVTMIYGARSSDLFASLEQFAATGMRLELCTDDGSRGHHGRVPDVLAELLGPAESDVTHTRRVVTCGPEIMMAKVAEVAAARSLPCQVSLETPMACGIGICFTCVARVRQPDGLWDYKRTCVEGPIFDATQIVW
jgi:dihydroorotate dehydrogenase electron transfer subunit